MKKPNKNPKNPYQIKLLREFNFLKSKEAMREALEYTGFIKDQERELEKLSHQQNIGTLNRLLGLEVKTIGFGSKNYWVWK